MNNQSDHGYSIGHSVACIACGSNDLHCCDGKGGRISFDAWADAVANQASLEGGLPPSEITAPYAEMYQEGLSVRAAVERVLA